MPLLEADAHTILDSEYNRAQQDSETRVYWDCLIRAMQRAYDLGLSDGETLSRIQAEN